MLRPATLACCHAPHGQESKRSNKTEITKYLDYHRNRHAARGGTRKNTKNLKKPKWQTGAPIAGLQPSPPPLRSASQGGVEPTAAAVWAAADAAAAAAARPGPRPWTESNYNYAHAAPPTHLPMASTLRLSLGGGRQEMRDGVGGGGAGSFYLENGRAGGAGSWRAARRRRGGRPRDVASGEPSFHSTNVTSRLYVQFYVCHVESCKLAFMT